MASTGQLACIAQRSAHGAFTESAFSCSYFGLEQLVTINAFTTWFCACCGGQTYYLVRYDV